MTNAKNGPKCMEPNIGRIEIVKNLKYSEEIILKKGLHKANPYRRFNPTNRRTNRLTKTAKRRNASHEMPK